jgi:hypothetical protein
VKLNAIRCTCVYYSNAGTNGKKKNFSFERFSFQTQKRCSIYFPVQLGTESEWLSDQMDFNPSKVMGEFLENGFVAFFSPLFVSLFMV